MNAVAVRVVYHFIMKVEPVSFPSKVVFTTKENRIDPPGKKSPRCIYKNMSGQCCVQYVWLDLREAGLGKKGKMERGLGTGSPSSKLSIGEHRHCCVTFEI